MIAAGSCGRTEPQQAKPVERAVPSPIVQDVGKWPNGKDPSSAGERFAFVDQLNAVNEQNHSSITCRLSGPAMTTLEVSGILCQPNDLQQISDSEKGRELIQLGVTRLKCQPL